MKERNIIRRPLNITSTQRAITRRRPGITKKDRMKRADWTCPGLMDTPKSARVRAQGVHGGEGRETEAAEVFG